MTFEECLRQYEPLCYSIVKDYYVVGATWDDLLQEAHIGLWEAWQGHDPTRGPFMPFAKVVVRRRVQDFLTAANRQRQRPLYNYGQVAHVEGTLAEPRCAPASEDIEAQELLDEFYESLTCARLTKLERVVVGMRIGGCYSYLEVGERLGVPPKTVDNAFQRAKKKLACSRSLAS